jgi:hypothetical protein
MWILPRPVILPAPSLEWTGEPALYAGSEWRDLFSTPFIVIPSEGSRAFRDPQSRNPSSLKCACEDWLLRRAYA